MGEFSRCSFGPSGRIRALRLPANDGAALAHKVTRARDFMSLSPPLRNFSADGSGKEQRGIGGGKVAFAPVVDEAKK
jgi:hypothetical protein